MKYAGYYPLIAAEAVAPTIFKFIFDAGDIAALARPGQFIQIKASDDCFPLWPRPFSIHDADSASGYLTIMFRIYGSGTAQLAVRRVGELVHLFGPLGNGFPELASDKNVIMAAGGVGLPPLYFLAKNAVQKGMAPEKISFIAGAKTATELLNEPGLFDLGLTPIVCTDDGTAGRAGTVVSILGEELASRPKVTVYACGPNAMLRAADLLLAGRNIPAFLSLEALMPCGYGICSGCAVKVHPPADRGPTDDRRDYHLKRVCCDGPVFPAGEVMWD